MTGTKGRAARVVALVAVLAVGLVVGLGADASLQPEASSPRGDALLSLASRGKRFGETFVVEACSRGALGSARLRGGGLVAEDGASTTSMTNEG